VDTSDILAGGTRRFTLAVNETEKESRTVTVDLEVEADLSRGVGVFAVDSAGGMTRITAENAEDYAHGDYAEEKKHWFAESRSVDFASVDSLLRALMWVDRYALPGTEGAWREYLIRMEKDEAIPKVALTCTHSKGIELIQTPWVKIRLRGYGGERRITKDRTGLSTYRSSGNASTESLINLGNMQSTMNPIALQLERDITIDAGDGEDPLFPSSESNGTREMIFVGERGLFILGEGSKLTRYNTTGLSSSLPLISSYGSTEMNGGAITDCTIGGNWFPISGNFIYRSGIFSGNNFDSPAFTEG
jgi:hypothetical protein